MSATAQQIVRRAQLYGMFTFVVLSKASRVLQSNVIRVLVYRPYAQRFAPTGRVLSPLQ